MFSSPECITWLAVGLTECVAIVTLNVATITVFIKNRNLLKRGRYLVLNLAVADMLIGVVAAAHDLFYDVGARCHVWKYGLTDQWPLYVVITLIQLFPVCSITNITAISVERLHATLRPFRHRVINKSVYGIVIAVIWGTAGVLSIALTVLLNYKGVNYYFYLWHSFNAICLLVICISYSSIVVKVHCGAQPQRHGAASRERKLTMTLLIVTVVSLLLYLPDVIFHFFEYVVRNVRLHNTLNVLLFANFLVNPLLYAIRMPEYRSAVLALFRRRPQQQRELAALPLHNM